MERTAAVAIAVGLACAAAPASAATPAELGDVEWTRDYEQARRLSEKTGRPLLILFDEVPGCSTCVRYGQHVLTHPLIVEAAETLFVPLAIYNNVPGPDRKVLQQFGEPTWNNPVVRIVDAQARPLTARLAGRYDQASLVAAMQEALRAQRRPVPGYLQLLGEALTADRTDTALFAMHCFWSGEVCLGAIDGVVGTRTGWRSGREVVEVVYDPDKVSLKTVLAAGRRCADQVFVPKDKVATAQQVFRDRVTVGVEMRPSPKDDRYQLTHSRWARVPMTPLQAQRVNADLGRRRDPQRWLSPRQIDLAQAISSHPFRRWPRLTGDLRTDMRRLAAAAS